MHKVAIIFERTVNRGFGDEKDRVNKHGKKVIGTKGEHVQEWRCELCDRLGWPVVGLDTQYFISKVAAGYKPIRIENEAPPPASWSDEQVQRVRGAINYVRPMVQANQQLREMDEQAKRGSKKKGVRESTTASAQPLSEAGASDSL